MATLLEYLRKFDTPTLELLAGSTIVKAVRSVYDTNRGSALARLVADKFGVTALSDPRIRSAALDSVSAAKAREFCSQKHIHVRSGELPQAVVHSYFRGGFSLKKSAELVELLELPDEYRRTTEVELREPSEFLQAIASESATRRLRGFLHPYQKRVKNQLNAAVFEHVSRVMVQMPTGSGKTATALESAVDLFRSPYEKRFVVWLVNSNELAEQALETFRSIWSQKGDHPLWIYRCFGGFDPEFQWEIGGFVFASFQSLRNPLVDSSHPRHAVIWRLVKSTDLLVVDEAHASVAETYEETVRAFVDAGSARLVGLSATPARNDGEATRALSRLYTGQLIRVTDEHQVLVPDVVGYLQEEGYLARVRIEELESGVTEEGIDEGGVCRALAENPARNELILKQIERAQQLEDPTLVFSCTKDHVFALVALCRSKQIPVDFIVGETSMAMRNKILEKFRNGNLGILINFGILSTGVDLPNLRRLIVTRPVASPIEFSQIIGRALRGPKNGGNRENVVVSIRDNLLNFPDPNYVFQSFANEFLSAG